MLRLKKAYIVDFIVMVIYAKNGTTPFWIHESEKEQVAGPNNAMDIKPGYRGRAFTSDLSGQEFWLVVDKGFQPMGLVMGNCIYSMGAVRNWLVGVKGNFQGKLKEYSQLMYQARSQLTTLPDVIVRDRGITQCGIVTFTVEGHDPEDIKRELATSHINVSVAVRSSALLDMDARKLTSVVRASVHYYNSEEEVERFCQQIKTVVGA